MSFLTLSYEEKRARLIAGMQKMAVLEVRAIQDTPWLDTVTSQHEITKAKAGYQLVVKIFEQLDKPVVSDKPSMAKIWDWDREVTANYIALVLTRTRARDLRLAKLSKVLRGIPKMRASIEELDQSAATELEIEAEAQEIISNTNMAISFLQFVAENPHHLASLAVSIWNQTAGRLARKMFNLKLSELDTSQLRSLSEVLAPLLQKTPGIEAATLAWLKRKAVTEFNETRVLMLDYDLFRPIDSIPEGQIAQVWLKPRMLAFVQKLGELVGPATILVDIVTVVLDTVDEVDRWAGSFARSASAAYAGGAVGALLGGTMRNVGLGALATGSVTADMTVMEAALVALGDALPPAWGVAAGTSAVPPVAAFFIVTGLVVAVGIVIEALVDLLLDVFFGPEHIPASLRANYALPISTAQFRALAAPISAH